MPKTLFRPEIDGVAHPSEVFTDESADSSLRKQFLSDAAHVIAAIEPLYGGALEYYRVETQLTASIAADIPPDFMQQRIVLLGILDFFYSRRLRPHFYSSTAGDDGRLARYLQRRACEHVGCNAAQLLTWLAIGHLIPQRWVSADQLLGTVKQEMADIGITANSSVALDLKIPEGGNSWLAEQSLKECARLKAHLDAGRPRPVRLFECGRNPFRNRTIIVYGYEEFDPQDIKLYVYDVNGLPIQKTLRCRRKNGLLFVAESQLFPQADAVKGFFCEKYVPESPPRSGQCRWRDWSILPKPLWYILRYARLLRLRLRAGS